MIEYWLIPPLKNSSITSTHHQSHSIDSQLFKKKASHHQKRRTTLSPLPFQPPGPAIFSQRNQAAHSFSTQQLCWQGIYQALTIIYHHKFPSIFSHKPQLLTELTRHLHHHQRLETRVFNAPQCNVAERQQKPSKDSTEMQVTQIHAYNPLTYVFLG